jgi:hypothetical protein
MKTKVFYLTLFICFNSFAPLGRADVNAPLLPGHKAIEGDLLKISDVVIAKINSFGVIEADNAGALSYEQVNIEITSVLKGKLSGKYKVSFELHTFPPSEHEIVPTLGIEYIMFIKTLSPDEYEVVKVLPSSAQNVARIKALIAAVPAGK